MELLAIFALVSAATINAGMPGPLRAAPTGSGNAEGMFATMPTSAGAVAGDLALVAAVGAVLLGAVSITTSSLQIVNWAGASILMTLALSGFRRASPVKPFESTYCGWADPLLSVALSFSSPANLVFLIKLLPQFVPITNCARMLGCAMLSVFSPFQ